MASWDVFTEATGCCRGLIEIAEMAVKYPVLINKLWDYTEPYYVRRSDSLLP